MFVFQRILQKEKRRIERTATTNTKLLHECEILRSRLQECSVNFLVEEEDKLILDTSSPSDAIDLLTTSDNRIGLLLAEVCFALVIGVLLSVICSYFGHKLAHESTLLEVKVRVALLLMPRMSH